MLSSHNLPGFPSSFSTNNAYNTHTHTHTDKYGFHSSWFSLDSYSFMGFKKLCSSVLPNWLGCHMTQTFASHKNTTFLTMYKNILTFPQWDKTSRGTGQLSANHSYEGTGEEEEDVYISDFKSGLRLKEEEQIHKEKSVSVLSVWVEAVPFLLFPFYIRMSV
jgi:hypothetical protein